MDIHKLSPPGQSNSRRSLCSCYIKTLLPKWSQSPCDVTTSVTRMSAATEDHFATTCHHLATTFALFATNLLSRLDYNDQSNIHHIQT